MRQAIVTKYHGPGNRIGTRISATASAGRVYVSYDHAGNLEANHKRAAQALANKFGWRGVWHGGGLPDGSYVFVAINSFPEDGFKTEGKN